MKVLSVICARKGSKGVRNKCIRKIDNQFVAKYSIDYSLSLGDRVKTVISTNINELIEYAKENNIPYINRDESLCADESKIEDALIGAIEKFGQDCSYCSLVYGNVPTRYTDIFFEALDFLDNNKDFDAAISMQNVGKVHPTWTFDMSDKIMPKVKALHYRRQTMPEKMFHDGHTILFRIDQFRKKYETYHANEEYMYHNFGYTVKPMLSEKPIIEIDFEKDFHFAEALILREKYHL